MSPLLGSWSHGRYDIIYIFVNKQGIGMSSVIWQFEVLWFDFEQYRVIQAPQGIGCKLFSGGYQSRGIANDIFKRDGDASRTRFRIATILRRDRCQLGARIKVRISDKLGSAEGVLADL
ncbi:hypothetical protein Tco_0805352 [Tanacetum coccineum]